MRARNVTRIGWLLGWCVSLFTLGACAPDYANTAFRCDTDRGGDQGCPAAQTCIAGRCRRGTPPASTIACMDVTCTTPAEQCCIDVVNAPRCIPAGDVCPGSSALCDGRADCADGDLCCHGETNACGAGCEETACISGADCPSDKPNCCDLGLEPWGQCTNVGC